MARCLVVRNDQLARSCERRDQPAIRRWWAPQLRSRVVWRGLTRFRPEQPQGPPQRKRLRDRSQRTLRVLQHLRTTGGLSRYRNRAAAATGCSPRGSTRPPALRRRRGASVVADRPALNSRRATPAPADDGSAGRWQRSPGRRATRPRLGCGHAPDVLPETRWAPCCVHVDVVRRFAPHCLGTVQRAQRRRPP
jgi:hypothetical protein